MAMIQQRAAGAEKGETHASGDGRFKMLDASMKRQRFQPDALIEVLHTAQELFGYLQDDILHYVAHGLKLPPSRVYGVATFYHFFTFTPKAAHSCVVCLGTACYVKGGEGLLSSVRQSAAELNAQAGGNGTFVSVATARCLGACGLAPVVVIDGEVCGTMAPDRAVSRMKGWPRDGSR
ncbi:MAG: bidirectional hydrogenase complex protein HoxE [Isosphaeraceae bacterium]